MATRQLGTAARVVHEQYRQQVTPGSTPAARPWEGLDRFLKESNVRLVTSTLGAIEALGRSWLPADAHNRAGLIAGAELSPAEVEGLAAMEHESWLRYHVDHGWRWGETRDNARRMHPALRPWVDLDRAARQPYRGQCHRRSRDPRRTGLPVRRARPGRP